MTYTCEDCGFIFFREGEVTECPSCEKNRIRIAAEEEIRRLQTFLEQGKPALRDKEQ
ncbi:MAG: hypothetical protein GXW85_12975 [Clostridia bacterium]|nr:hypothetical protein [Clostridia bacterium]